MPKQHTYILSYLFFFWSSAKNIKEEEKRNPHYAVAKANLSNEALDTGFSTHMYEYISWGKRKG